MWLGRDQSWRASVIVLSNGTEPDEEKFIYISFALEKDEFGFKVRGKSGNNHRHSSKLKEHQTASVEQKEKPSYATRGLLCPCVLRS